jgi:hypothetical protein
VPLLPLFDAPLALKQGTIPVSRQAVFPCGGFDIGRSPNIEPFRVAFDEASCRLDREAGFQNYVSLASLQKARVNFSRSTRRVADDRRLGARIFQSPYDRRDRVRLL